jgi:hypothetical protein
MVLYGGDKLNKLEMLSGISFVSWVRQVYFWEDLELDDDLILKLKQIEQMYCNRVEDNGGDYRVKIGLYGKEGVGKTLIAKVLCSSSGVPPLCIIDFKELCAVDEEGSWSISLLSDVVHACEGVFLFKNLSVGSDAFLEFKRLLDEHVGYGLIIVSLDDDGVYEELKPYLDEVVHVPLPDKDLRVRLFMKFLRVMRKESFSSDDYGELAMLTDGFTGRDIRDVCILAYKECDLKGDLITVGLLKDVIKSYKTKRVVLDSI